MTKPNFLAVRLLQEDRTLRETDPIVPITFFDLDNDNNGNKVNTDHHDVTSTTVRDVLAMCRNEFDIKNIGVAFPKDVMVLPPIRVTWDYVVGPYSCRCRWSKKQQGRRRADEHQYIPEFRNEDSILMLSYSSFRPRTTTKSPIIDMSKRNDDERDFNNKKGGTNSSNNKMKEDARKSYKLFHSITSSHNNNDQCSFDKSTAKLLLDWGLNPYHTLKGMCVVALPDITSIFVTCDEKHVEFIIPNRELMNHSNNTLSFVERRTSDGKSNIQFLKEYPTVKEIKQKICETFQLKNSSFRTFKSNSFIDDDAKTYFQIENAPENQIIHNLGLSGPALFVSLIPWNDDIEVTIVTLTGKKLSIRIPLDCTVTHLKEYIQNEEGIPVDQMRLLYRGAQLEDGVRLDHYGIEYYSTIYLMLRLRGGMFHETSAKQDYEDCCNDDDGKNENDDEECNTNELTHVKVLFPTGEEGMVPCACGDKISDLKENIQKLYIYSRRRTFHTNENNNNMQTMVLKKNNDELCIITSDDNDDDTEISSSSSSSLSYQSAVSSSPSLITSTSTSHSRLFPNIHNITACQSSCEGRQVDFAMCPTNNKEEILIEMLKRECQLRKCEDVQKRIELAERSVDQDWMDVIQDVQHQVVKEFSEAISHDGDKHERSITDEPISIHELRQAALRHPEVAFWVKYNRARRGDLKEGDVAPDVAMSNLATGKMTTLLSALPSADENEILHKPCVVFAGSLSCPPFRYLAPFLAQMSSSEKGQKVATWKMIYIAEAHAMNEWPIRSGRYSSESHKNGPPIIVPTQPTTVAERTQVAKEFLEKFSDVETAFRHGHLQIFIDDPQIGEPFENVYAPWPLRLYMIDSKGKLEWIASPKQCSFDEAIANLMQRLELW